MPEALIVGAAREESEGESSREARSSVPLDFLGAALAPAAFGLEGSLASSSASRASRSAFFAAASAALAAAASLVGEASVSRYSRLSRVGEKRAYFFAFDFAPFDHS